MTTETTGTTGSTEQYEPEPELDHAYGCGCGGGGKCGCGPARAAMDGGGADPESPLNQDEEETLAAELLEVADEQELEAFLGRLVAPVARRGGGLPSPAVGRALGDVLKNVAQATLPLRGVRGAAGTAPGRLVVGRLPMLSAHAGTPPDLVLKWNAMARPTRIDVVIHLHGHSGRGRAMRLPRDMEPISGLDFAEPTAPHTAGRTAPTLLVLPRGHYYGGRSGRGYTFPALEPPGAVRALADEALARFGAVTGVRAPLGRLILTAHSGGGASLMKILRHTDPEEVHTFDALYGDPKPLITWARRRIERGSGALRVLYRPGEKTAGNSEKVAAAVRPAGARRFRVESTRVGHGAIPRRYGWRLLADAGADLPGTAPAPPGPRRGGARPRRTAPKPIRPMPLEAAYEHPGTGGTLVGDRPPTEVASPGGTWTGTAAQEDFRRRVLAAHLARSRARTGRPPGRDLTPGELARVTGTGIRMRADAAAAAGRLLAAANRALAEARVRADADAARTRRIDATSGYRHRQHQERLWRGYFPRYYNETADGRARLRGGPHGAAAVRYMIDVFGIPARIAAPGYSNHQNGIAIDFLQRRAPGHRIANSTRGAAVRRWRETWFHRWLRSNARAYGFEPYEREPWHWEYRPTDGPRRAAGTSARRARPRTGLLLAPNRETRDTQNDAFEAARRFVRLAAASARNAAAPRFRRAWTGGSGPYGDGHRDLAIARAAFLAAAGRHAPGLAPSSYPRRTSGRRVHRGDRVVLPEV